MDTPNATSPAAAAVPAAEQPRTPENRNGEQEQNTEPSAPAAEKPKKPGMFGKFFGGRRTEKPKLSPQRLQFYADEHGHLDLSRTHPDNIEKLKVGISSTPVRQALGLVNDDAAPAGIDKATLTAYLVDTANDVLARMAQQKWNLTADQVKLLLLKRDPKTDQSVKVLTDALLNKYFPDGFGNYDLELSFCIVVGGFVQNAIAEIRQTAPATRPTAVAFPQSSSATN